MGVAAPWLLGAAWLAAHLPALAPSLEDIDSINFALALRDFDPAEHQPHPPGYPIYVAAGRVALMFVTALHPLRDRVGLEALALSVCSVVAGALAVTFAWRVFGLLAAGIAADVRGRVRLWATLLLAACPLFWITGVRPLSDMPGLAAALGVQALLLGGRVNSGAFFAGLILGIRSQTLWLTAPLVAVALLRCGGPRAWRDRAAIVALAAAGALCWAVPLVIATGGLERYVAALGSQAGEDLAFVDMLWANPSPRRLALGIIHTFVMPWASVQLAGAVLALAAAGAVVLLAREPHVLLQALAAFAPYIAFHLVFQETVTVRYALPAVVPVALMAARALALAGRATNVVATPVVVLVLLAGLVGTAAYARAPHPAFRAIADAVRRAEVDPPELVTSHFELRRPLRAAEPVAFRVTEAANGREWLELVRYWSGGGRGVAWFLANPRRTNLDLVDPHSRRDVVRYRWQADGRSELSGTRPAAVDWYRLRPPGWFAGEGWSLTPEVGGLTQAAGTGPDRRPIDAYVRRGAGPMHAVVGGRYMGTASDPQAAFELAIDGSVIDQWTVAAADPAFLRIVDLPAGIPAGPGDYARLSITARPDGTDASSRTLPPLAIRQFDVQPTSRAIAGFGAGWHDEEYDAQTGARWRWTTERAVLHVRAAAAVRIRMRGDSPLRDFDAPPTVTLSAAGRVIERLEPRAAWTLDVRVPGDLLSAAAGALTIDTSRVFVPAEIRDSPDTRRLGLRIFALDVESVR